MLLSNRLRIVPVNAADSAVLTASSQASADTGPAWLQTVGRTDIWRAAGTAATLTAVLDSLITPIDCVAIMTSNLSSACTWRVRLLSSGGVVLFDSGSVLACPPLPFAQFDWGFQPLGVNAFTFGLSAQSVCWLPARVAAASVLIDIVDPSNPAGYVEAARLVIGETWSPDDNYSYGSSLVWSSLSKSSRAEDGTLRTDAGASLRRFSLALDSMTETDRRRFAEIGRNVGLVKDFLVSARPADADASVVADYTMMAKFARDPAHSRRSFGRYAAAVEIEEA